MPSSIDNRIVEMKFNNADFERRVASTIANLEKLNAAIDLTGSKKGLGDLADNIKGFNMNPMASAIDGISNKFLALSAVAITVLANITNRVVDAGIQMGKSLTLDPLMQGFREYETNMNSIQTMLANTKQQGTTLDDVNASLDELNEYSDKTIYNFAEMARNIGTFTAAGVDLDTSVSSIKGIANLAAISGSSSQQASTAMYQLSQAIATGSLKLMDWNSVVNAGMGGQVFQNALFETGKAMGTITDVPIDQTFDEWKDAGNSFRESLQDGWVTTEVLTTALRGFTGEMTEAELAALGFTEAQIANIQEMGQTGVEAATKVRTLSQLLDTTKESIASGWSQSFRTVFGDFEEATELFTGVSDAISGMVSNSSEARNEMLTGWAEMGGRKDLIEGIKNSFLALSEILSPIKEGFRDIFPPMTAERLAELTERFREIMEAARPSEETMDRIRRTFRGLFAVLDIGFAIVKEVWGVFKELFGLIAGPSSTGILATTANFGDFLVGIRDILIDGGKLGEWFQSLKDFIKDPIPYLRELIDTIDEFLQGLGVDIPGIWSKISEVMGSDLVQGLKNGIADGVDAIADWAMDIIDKVKEILGISSPSKVFEDIGKDIVNGLIKGIEAGASIVKGAFDALMDADVFEKAAKAAEKVWDVIQKIVDAFQEVFEFPSLTTLFAFSGAAASGGIFIMLKKIADFFGDSGLGAIKESVVGTLDGVTDVLKSMSLDIKAGALLKIAGAVALLAASLILLAFVDGEKLAKSTAALAGAFTQLIASFAVLQALSSNPKSGLNMIGLALGLGLLAGAILLLSASLALMSRLSWEEIGAGLTAVTGLLVSLVATAKGLEGSSASLARAGAGMLVIGGALLVLALAMKIFAMMDLRTIGQGLGTVAMALGLIVASTRLFPADMAARTAGLMVLAGALLTIAVAMKLISTMNLTELAKGIAGVSVSLVAIGTAIKLMDEKDLTKTSLAILALAASTLFIGKAMEKIGQLSWNAIAKSLTAITLTMTVLSLAIRALEGGIKGGIALLLITKSLDLFKDVLMSFADISWSDLASGLGKLAISLGVIAGGALLLQPALPALILLGAGLLAIGVGFAAIGVGANLFAKAIKIVADLGPKGGKAVEMLLANIGRAIPLLAKGVALGLVELAETLLGSVPVFIELIYEIVKGLLAKLTELIPELKDALVAFVTAGLEAIRELAPEFVQTGWDILMAFLSGIADNIGELVSTVASIITGFLDALAEETPGFIDSTVNLLITALNSIAEGLGKVAGTMMTSLGVSFLTGFIDGMKTQIQNIYKAIKDIVDKVIGWFKSGFGIFSPSRVMKTLGGDLMLGLINGIVEGAKAVINWFKDLAGNTLTWIGDLTSTLVSKGSSLIRGLYTGVTNFVRDVLKAYFIDFPMKVLGWIGDVATILRTKGWDLIVGMYNGVIDFVNEKLMPWFRGIKDKILGWIGDAGQMLWTTGWNIVVGLKNGIAAKWSEFTDWLTGKVDGLVDLVKKPWNIFSPSRTAAEIGGYIVEGLALGMRRNENRPITELENINAAMKNALERGRAMAESAVDGIAESIDMVITPVLDLTNLQRDSRRLAELNPGSSSYVTAAGIASTRIDTPDLLGEDRNPEIKFEQNVYAPKQLSTADIYRQTKNQITLAKEELSIP